MKKVVEFETELDGSLVLNVPPEVAGTLPHKGKATVVVFLDLDPGDAEWRTAAYRQFLRDDSEEDAIYDKYR